jgi:hypothetical protein
MNFLPVSHYSFSRFYSHEKPQRTHAGVVGSNHISPVRSRSDGIIAPPTLGLLRRAYENSVKEKPPFGGYSLAGCVGVLLFKCKVAFAGCLLKTSTHTICLNPCSNTN